MIAKNSQVPLWKQLKDELVKLVLSGKFQEGANFYSLSEIADQFQVSMITVRRVMQEMASEGYLEIIPGKKAKIAGTARKDAPLLLRKVAVFFYSPVPNGTIQYETMPWTSLIYSGMQEGFLKNNLLWTMVPVQDSKDAREKLKQLEQDHQAFIFITASIGGQLVGDLSARKRPYLIIQPKTQRCAFNYVAADHFAGGVEIAEIAIRKNYRSFLYLSGSYTDTVEKLRGFQETLLERGIHPRSIYLYSANGITQEKGAVAFEKFLSENRQEDLFPLAVYTSGDYLALGVLASCRKLGLSIPTQVGIAGSTGTPEAEHAEPPLTTSEIPMREMGYSAVEMICEMMNTSQTSLEGKIFKETLHDRGSL